MEAIAKAPVAVESPAARKYLEEWRAVIEPTFSNMETATEFRRRVARYLDFLEQSGTAFDEVTPKTVRAFLSNYMAGQKPGSKRNFLETVRRWYRWLLEKGAVKSNPADFSSVAHSLAVIVEQTEAVDQDYPTRAQMVPRIQHNSKPGFKVAPDYKIEERTLRHVENWLVHLEAFGMKLNTRKSYRPAVIQFLWYVEQRGRKFDHLEARDLDAWLLFCQKDRKLYVRTINGAISAVRNFYRWLRRNNFIVDNPAGDFLRMLKAPRLLPRPISEQDVAKIIAAAVHVQDRAMLETVYATGARIGEMQAMSVGGVDLRAGTIITIGKYSRERLLHLCPSAVQALAAWIQYRKDSGEKVVAASPLWKSAGGVRMEIETIRGHIKATAKRAGVEGNVTPHQFRHSYGTHLLDHGADLRAVQELMGHDHIASTQIYTGVSPVRMGEVYRKAHPGFRKTEGGTK